MIYQADPNAIREKQNDVEQAQLEKRISILEKELELLNEQKDKLSEQREEIEAHYQELIDETNKYYDEAIKRIDEYIEKWEELSELEENALMLNRLESIGLSMEDILSLDEGSFEAFKENYVGLLNDIYGQNDRMTKALEQEAGGLSSYLENLQPLFDQLERLDLTSVAAAMDSLNLPMQTIADCLLQLAPNSEEGVKGINNVADAFKNASDAAKDVTNAVNGSGGSTGSGTGTGETGSAESEASSAGTDLASAISDLDDLASARLGKEGVLGKFETIQKYIVEDLIPAIKGSENSLYSAIKEVCNEEYEISIAITPVGPPQLLAQMGYYGEEKGNLPTAGAAKALGFANGTVGAAFFDGYPGLNSPEQNALRSEFGQPELTVYPDGTYELTTQPTFADLPKGTVIFNEEQTKRILKGNGKSGKAFADGSNSNIRPLSQAMPEKDAMFKMFEANLQENIKLMSSNIAEMTTGIRDIAQTVNNITNNGGLGQSFVINGGINVTCPGVTKAEVAAQLGDAFDMELSKRFSGFSLFANQRAMRR